MIWKGYVCIEMCCVCVCVCVCVCCGLFCLFLKLCLMFPRSFLLLLQQVRRVLQHQLHEARGQLEPMDTEMTTMKETIEELNKEYTSGMKAAAVLERKTKTSNHKQTILQKELIKGSNKITKLKSTILKFSRDVESIVTQPGSNHAKWAEGLLDLYKTYVSHVCSCSFDAPCV